MKNKPGTGYKSEGESVRGVMSCWYTSFKEFSIVLLHQTFWQRIFFRHHASFSTYMLYRGQEQMNCLTELWCILFSVKGVLLDLSWIASIFSFYFLDLHELNDLYLRVLNWLLLFITIDRSPSTIVLFLLFLPANVVCFSSCAFLLSTKDCGTFPNSLVINENKAQRKEVCEFLAGGQEYSSN